MLNSLQTKLLEMLDFFHHYCVDNNIKYYICAGTMLGAMRHKGFIPWDDDVDVMVPRPDYDRLIRIFTSRIDHYELECPYSSDEYYPYSFAKLYDTNTTMVEHLRFDCKRGIALDVFPLDGVGNTMEEVKKNYRSFCHLQAITLTQVCALRKDRSIWKNAAIMISRLIPKKLVDIKSLTIQMDKKSKEYGYENSKYVMTYITTYGLRDVMDKTIYGKPTEYSFENIVVFGVEKPEEYLTRLYGDWKKLPPQDKRHSAHDFIQLDLNKPYKV